MPLRVDCHVLGPLENNAYVVTDRATGALAVVDPPLQGETLLSALTAVRQNVVGVLLTHAHFDHVGSLAAFQRELGAPTMMHAAETELLQDASGHALWFDIPDLAQPGDADRLLTEGQVVTIGAGQLQVLETPGHSPGGLSFYCEADGFVLTGDALFAGSVGRTDLPGGDHATLLASIRTKLLTLPDETVVYSGHGPATTIGQERQTNPFLRG